MHFKFKHFGRSSSQKPLTAQEQPQVPDNSLKAATDVLEIESQALDELDSSTSSWESQFEKWQSEWREGLKSLSFDRVRRNACEVLDVDLEIRSLIAPLPVVRLAPLMKPGKNVEGSLDSQYGDFAAAYQPYSSLSSIDLNDPFPHAPITGEDEPESYEVSIVDDDNYYAELARDIPDSQQSKLSQKLHVYHDLRL